MRDVRTAATDAWMDLWGKPHGSVQAGQADTQTGAARTAAQPAPTPAAPAAQEPSTLERAWTGVRSAQAAHTATTEQHALAASSWAGRAMRAVDGLAASAHEALPDGIRHGLDAAESARESVAGAVGDAWNWAGDHVDSAAKATDRVARQVGTAVDGAADQAVATGTEAVRRHVGEGAANAFKSGADAVHGGLRAGVQFEYGATKGALSELGSMVSGAGHLAGEAYKLEVDPAAREQAASALASNAVRVAEDPVGTEAKVAGAVYDAGAGWVKGAKEASAQGELPEYLGRATGHVAAAVASVVVPGAVAGKLGEAANMAGRLGEGSSVVASTGEIARAATRVEEAATTAGTARAAAASGETPAAGMAREVAGQGSKEAAASGVSDASAAKAPEPLREPASQPPSPVPAAPPIVRTFGTFEEFAKATNAAEPNSIYRWGSYDWETDAAGRTVRAQGKVEVQAFGRNDPKLQQDIGKNTPGRQDGDIGFHLIGDGFNAPTVRVNVVPGNGVSLDGLKSLNLSAYKKFENTVRSLASRPGADVEIRIEAIYNSGNATRRPDLFRASFREKGGKWIENVFANKPQ